MTDYTDPSTIDVDEVCANIDHNFKMRGHLWDDRLSWPNITVKAMSNEIARLRNERDHLQRQAYVTIRLPRWLARRAP